MARKPPDWRQPSLFPPDPATGLSSAKAGDAGQAPANTPEPQDHSTSHLEGDHHAVQDPSPRTSEGTDGSTRTVSADAEAPADPGNLRPGTEDQPRSLEGDSHP